MTIVSCPKCGAKNRVDESKTGRMQPKCGRCETALTVGEGGGTDGHPVEVTDATFAQLLGRSRGVPVLVDCWAEWCGPCRMLTPTLEQLAGEAGGRYVIAKLNVDENPRTASEFNISSIPTMLIFKDGKLVDQVVGLAPKAQIEQRLLRHATGAGAGV